MWVIMTHVLGIDYSLSCPALCFLDPDRGPQWWVHYKLHGKPYKPIPRITWTPSTTVGEIPRYIELAQWVLQIVDQQRPSHIILEDYAFGASGRLTQLSENAGTLKVKLFETFPTIPVHVVAPTSMKKFATGKGNATKDIIWEAFVATFPEGKDWHTHCHPKAKKIGSPAGDIADAYFLAQYGVVHYV